MPGRDRRETQHARWGRVKEKKAGIESEIPREERKNNGRERTGWVVEDIKTE